MVETQLTPRGIADPRVLDAFMSVERVKFIPEALAEVAYADHPLPIGDGQTISQPYIVALMTEKMGLKGDEKILEIGTGSGYQAAILSTLCREVYTVERDQRLYDRARKVLGEQGYTNIRYRLGDGTKGWEDEAPFDGIIVTAAAPFVPEPLREQLAEGGHMVIPVGDLFSQMLMLLERKNGKFEQSQICSCVFVPLIGEHGWRRGAAM